MADSKWENQFPIYEQIGNTTLRDIPLDQVNPYWRGHYQELRVFFKKYKQFLKQYPQFQHYKMPACSIYDEKFYERYRSTTRYQWLSAWSQAWCDFLKTNK